MAGKRILIVAAHPDDEILGCGATVAKLVDEGCEAQTIILGEGKTSRSQDRNVDDWEKEMSHLKNEVKTCPAAACPARKFSRLQASSRLLSIRASPVSLSTD